MLISTVLPLADGRLFDESGHRRLPVPDWPDPAPNEFLRSFGRITMRRRGGLDGWVGEHALCDAHRGLRFCNLRQFASHETGRLSLLVRFRRFYFDGWAVGKFDIGMLTQPIKGLSFRHAVLNELLKHVLNAPITIRTNHLDTGCSPLLHAGPKLQELYVYASRSLTSGQEPPDGLIAAGVPMVFIECPRHELASVPSYARPVPIWEQHGFRLLHWWHEERGRIVGVWLMQLDPYFDREAARALRIYLTRLHAEHEVLRRILRMIEQEKIAPVPRGPAAQALQAYLEEATRRIARLSRNSERMTGVELAELARVTEDQVTPGRREKLLEKLRIVDIRRNIVAKVERFSDRSEQIRLSIYAEEVNIMRDQYNVRAAGAVGPGAKAENFEQTWQEIQGKVDLAALARELALLHDSMSKQAVTDEQKRAAQKVKEAEDLAHEGVGSSVMANLKGAGKWALDVAKSIGVPVAVAALSKALGLP